MSTIVAFLPGNNVRSVSEKIIIIIIITIIVIIIIIIIIKIIIIINNCSRKVCSIS